MEESELLRLLHRGDPAGLEALIVRYTPYVSAVAARILPGCPREWEEVAADVFWAAWQERKKLRPGRLKGWLSVTARNRALNLLRSRRETVPPAGIGEPGGGQSGTGGAVHFGAGGPGTVCPPILLRTDGGPGGGGDGDEPVHRQKQAAEGPGTAEGSIEKGGIRC